MTILTKPSNEKKPEKLPLPPLPLGDEVAMLHGGGVGAGGVARGSLLRQNYPYQSDVDSESMVFNRPQYACIKTVLLFFISVIVMMMGVLGGYTLYRMYAPTNHTNMHYRALCDIPYYLETNLTMPRIYERPSEYDWRSFLPHLGEDTIGELVDDNFFREEVELDLTDEESFAKIDVPDFRDGRRGRFMHDFKENQSAIIDTTAKRCFIMPLDRNTTLPPKSFMDLMLKMGSGYYNIDTDHVRHRMRVVLPPVSDLTLISERIANECFDMKVYMLENYVSGVFKREIREPLSSAAKFAQFGGKGILSIDLQNIAEVERYENMQN